MPNTQQKSKEQRLTELKASLNTKWIAAIAFIPISIGMVWNNQTLMQAAEDLKNHRAEAIAKAQPDALQSCFVDAARKNFEIAIKDGQDMAFTQPSINDPDIVACAQSRAEASVKKNEQSLSTMALIGSGIAPTAFVIGLYSAMTIRSQRRKIKALENEPS